jgi:hypothetical protein
MDRAGGTETDADMGERLTGDATPDRRHAVPDLTDPAGLGGMPVGRGGAGSGTAELGDLSGLEDFLALALRRAEPGAEGERRAVAAYLAARESGAHRARTRRRDDWRPREARARRPVRSTLAVLLAGLTLGGAAFAAVGGAERDAEDSGGKPATPSAGASDETGTSGEIGTPDAPGTPDGSAPGTTPSAGPAGRPPAAQDTDAHCRAYAQVRERGQALDSAAWQRLVRAAGGEDRVEAYCEERTRPADPAGGPAETPGTAADPGNATGGDAQDRVPEQPQQPADPGAPADQAPGGGGNGAGTGKQR